MTFRVATVGPDDEVRLAIARMAALEAEIVGVGHGDPITERAPDKVHEVTVRAGA